jgi:opacity protein-like surface antigen
MKKFTLMMAMLVVASFAFAQVAGIHAPTKTKAEKAKIELNNEKEAAWTVTFDGDEVWSITHDEGEADWTVSDSTTTGLYFENGVDFTEESLPVGTMVSSMWW